MKYEDPITEELKPIYFKVADTSPVGTIVEYDGEGVPDGYEEVLGSNDYSIEERQIGFWQKADGTKKPLYRKNFCGTFDDEQAILNDVDVIVSYGGMAYITGLGRIVPYYEIFDGNVYAFRITKNKNQIVVIVFANGNPTSAEAEFYIEYTKTTDTPSNRKTIRKKATSIGRVAKTVNERSNSKENVYSCDYINQLLESKVGE